LNKCLCSSGDLKASVHDEYYLCNECGSLVSIKPRNIQRYDFVGALKKHIIERSYLDFADRIPFWFNELKKIPLNDSILEIGCSHGGFLYYCNVFGFSRCGGVELIEELCQYARDTFNIKMVCADFPNVKIDEKFDIVCGFDIIEHLENPLEGLKKMAELGEYVVIQIPIYSGEALLDFPYFDAGVHLFIPSEKAINHLFDLARLELISSVQGAFKKNLTIIGRVKDESIN
jgi:SAM-dependent methyltransferase